MNMTTTQAEKDAWFEKIKTLDYFKTTDTTHIFSYFVYQPYYPKSLNFMPVTSAVFTVNDKVYEVKTRSANTEAELEAYLDNHPDVALYYVAVSTTGGIFRMHARFAHIDTDYRSPITDGKLVYV